jgi:hypothetical protein
MTVQNGTIQGVTLASGNPAGATALNGATVLGLKSYLLTVSFPAYTGSTDSMTVTGCLTAINNSCRDGKTRTLLAAIPAFPGLDGASPPQGVVPTGTSIFAMAVSNTTTTGDLAGNLSDASGTELTSTTGTTNGCGIIVTVAETPDA